MFDFAGGNFLNNLSWLGRYCCYCYPKIRETVLTGSYNVPVVQSEEFLLKTVKCVLTALGFKDNQKKIIDFGSNPGKQKNTGGNWTVFL